MSKDIQGLPGLPKEASTSKSVLLVRRGFSPIDSRGRATFRCSYHIRGSTRLPPRLLSLL